MKTLLSIFALLIVAEATAQTDLLTVTSRRYNKNSVTSIGPATIPQGIGTISLILTRENWASETNRMSFLVEVSLDSGSTWRQVGSLVTHGGVLTNKISVGATTNSIVTFNVPEPQMVGRRIRGTFTTPTAIDTSVIIRGFP